MRGRNRIGIVELIWAGVAVRRHQATLSTTATT
jgi:hypothetical protein